MRNENKLCIIVPARSGSKGIPNKNIREINGKSLLLRTFESATKICNPQNICFSTDSEAYYKHVAKKYNPIFLKRDIRISDDNSLAIEVWKDAISFLNKNHSKYEYSLFLEPTSPFRNIDWIKINIEKFIKSQDDLWMSVKETDSKFRIEKQFNLNNDGYISNIFNNSDKYSLRQNSKKTYFKDGVFYIAKNDYILQTNILFAGKIKGIINNYRSINIDTFDDLDFANFLSTKEF
tara:strand:+ start:18669 stop:19373 length:705 start_codon:yes stop_codon:yes gene_type:complete